MATNCVDLLREPMLDLLLCAETALDNCGRPVDLVTIAPGQTVAWDNCCENGGQLYVRAVEVFPTAGPGASFPAIDSQQQCGVTLLAAQLAVGVIRCAHTIDDEGNPPTAAEMTADALGTTADMSILLDAIRCCFGPQQRHFKLSNWTPQGVQGGCVGGEWNLFVAVSPCSCLPQDDPEE